MTDHDFEVRRDERAGASRREQQAAVARHRQSVLAHERHAFLQRLDTAGRPRPPAAPAAGGLFAALVRPQADAAEAELARLRVGCPDLVGEKRAVDAEDGAAASVAEHAAIREPSDLPPNAPAVAATAAVSGAAADGAEPTSWPLGNEQIERVEATLELAERLGQPELLLTIHRGPLAAAKVRVVVLAPGCVGLRLTGTAGQRRAGRKGVDALVQQLEATGLEVRDVGWVDGNCATPP